MKISNFPWHAFKIGQRRADFDEGFFNMHSVCNIQGQTGLHPLFWETETECSS